MAISIGQLFVRNWPIKLAAIFFAIMLYVAVAAQQPLTQSLAMHVAVAVPPGRSIRQQPANVTVVIIGKGTEVMKLRSISHVIHRVVPDTFSASVWHVHLQPADVEIPKGTDVQVADITPRDFDVVLDSVGTKDVKITPRVKVEADSGYVLRGFTIVPNLAHLIGPEKSLARIDSVTNLSIEIKSLARIDSVTTLSIEISSVTGPFFRTVPIDTALLGIVRISPKEVRVAGEVVAVIERSIPGVPVTTAASGFTGFLLSPERVAVSVRGPESKVNTLTKDSVRVVAHLVGKAGPGAYARLTVTAPPGVRARAVPDSVGLKRRTGRG